MSTCVCNYHSLCVTFVWPHLSAHSPHNIPKTASSLFPSWQLLMINNNVHLCMYHVCGHLSNQHQSATALAGLVVGRWWCCLAWPASMPFPSAQPAASFVAAGESDAQLLCGLGSQAWEEDWEGEREESDISVCCT